MIDLKTAERIVRLHEVVKSLRASLSALTGPGRKIASARISLVTAEGEGWSNSREQQFALENEEARQIAFSVIKRNLELRLAAAIRELHQLNAEVPHDEA